MSYSNSYTTITLHTRKAEAIKGGDYTVKGYQGYIKVISGATIDGKDLKSSYRVYCPIFRLTRADALKDAKNEKEYKILKSADL
jgi:hypothetical protein